MTEDRTQGIIRVVAFAMFLLYVILAHELTTNLTATMSYDARATISTLVFFGSFALYYVGVLLFLRWEGRSDINELGIGIDEDTGTHIAIGAIAGVVGVALVFAVAFFFGGSLTPVEDITADLIISEIMITAPVAFFEELTYRGYFMTRLEEVSNRGVALIISSLWFALLHFGWWFPLGQVAPHLILIFTLNLALGGIVLGLSYYLSGRRLWVAIAFHFAWNMLAYILFPVYPRETVFMPEIFQIEWGLVTIPAFILALSVLWLLLDIVKKKE
jgi:membrane protease YdiL (CAAX protease family)